MVMLSSLYAEVFIPISQNRLFVSALQKDLNAFFPDMPTIWLKSS